MPAGGQVKQNHIRKERVIHAGTEGVLHETVAGVEAGLVVDVLRRVGNELQIPRAGAGHVPAVRDLCGRGARRQLCPDIPVRHRGDIQRHMIDRPAVHTQGRRVAFGSPLVQPQDFRAHLVGVWRVFHRRVGKPLQEAETVVLLVGGAPGFADVTEIVVRMVSAASELNQLQARVAGIAMEVCQGT